MFMSSQFSTHCCTVTETPEKLLVELLHSFKDAAPTWTLNVEAFSDLLMSPQSLKIRRCYQHVFLLSQLSHLVNTAPHQKSFQRLHYESQGAPVQSVYQQTKERQRCEHLISLCGEKCFHLLTRAALKTCTASFTPTLFSLLHSHIKQSPSFLCWQLQSHAAILREWNVNLCVVTLSLRCDFFGLIPLHFCTLDLSVKCSLSWRKKEEQQRRDPPKKCFLEQVNRKDKQ